MRQKRGKIELGMTGNAAQIEAFGEVKNAVEHEQWLKEHVFMTEEEALRAVRENQPFDPTDPEPRFASDLHATVAEALCSEDYSRLNFFTAVNSHLDYAFGIDAFFEFQVEDEIVRVTLDVSTYEKDFGDADVLIVYPSEGLDPKADKEKWWKIINEAVEIIVEKTQNRIKRMRKGVTHAT